ncbi:hypothetical protein LTR84_010623 [Exophiala bonariae]|uniref:Uncharacterized protein n=1 Tax=Exophiala bonariae TaxID=1690606 RepID=A0AAV9MT71_9EURO|nr:hypothetical protein LTR84_010623 [Exophiala bonariae]
MDGDHTAKTFDKGANAATKVQDLTEGVHEGAAQDSAAGQKTTGHGTSIFSKDGAIGKQFTADQGGIGGTAQKIGGPLDKDGAIGKHFKEDGAIGGAFQRQAERNEGH